MRQTINSGGIKHHRPKIGDLGADSSGFGDDMVTRGRLLPGISNDNPDGREMCAKTDQDCANEMHPRTDFIPTEE